MDNSFLYNFSQNLNQEKAPAALYVVATPIGNLEDITLRALKVLTTVSHVICEDTRVSKKLFYLYGIHQKLTSYNDFSDEKLRTKIIDQIKAGESIALISDAGTPLISDPGYKLVSDCIEQDVQVIPIPGVSALTASLSACGFPINQFFFYGFLPKKEKKIEAAFNILKSLHSTIVCYESANRLLKTLKAMSVFFSDDFEVCVAREITKKFETFKKDRLDVLIRFFETHPPKGEIVIIFNTKDLVEKISKEMLVQMIHDADDGIPTKQIAKDLADKTNFPKREIYNLILELKSSC